MTDLEYFNYLKGRSNLASLYRKNILYPVLSKQFHGRVLDVGCGIGDFLMHRENTVGIDINEHNVNYCKSINLEAYHFNNGKFPFNDEVFEGTILDNVLEHLSDPSPTLYEIHRVLRHDGIFIVGVPGIKGYTMDADHKKFYREEDLEELLSAYGLKLIKYIYGPFMIKSVILSKLISQYCVFGVFKKD